MKTSGAGRKPGGSLERLPRWIAAVLAALTLTQLQAAAASPVHLRWEELPAVIGKSVRIATPGGAVITGRAMGVESGGLLVDVERTTSAKAVPKGPMRVPRASLRRFEMRTKGKKFRILGTVLGSAAGLLGGAFAAIGVQGGILSNRNEGAAVATLFGVWAGGTVAGYLAGNAADKHWTVVEIAQ